MSLANRHIYLDKIRGQLAYFQNLVVLSNSNSYFDINKVAENVVRDLLNIAYGYSLINLNEEQKNFPGIDLGDRSTGICFQVTSSKDHSKLKKKIQSYLKSPNTRAFPHYYIFLIAGKRELGYTTIEVGEFKVEANRIWDFADLYNRIDNLDIENIQRIADLLTEQRVRFEILNEAEKQYVEGLEAISSDLNDPFGSEYFPVKLFETNSNISPNRKFRNKDAEHFSFRSLTEVLEEKQRFLLASSPGSGKTKALKHIISTLVRDRSTSKSIIPIYIDLSRYQVPVSIDEAIIVEVEKLILPRPSHNKNQIAKELVVWWLGHEDLCILVDGYDEISSPYQKEWQLNLQTFFRQKPTFRLVIALRHSSIPQQILFPVTSTFSIVPFTRKQSITFIERILLKGQHPISSETRESTARRIVNILDNSNWEVTPLLISMISKLVQENTLKESTQNWSQATIYKNYFDLLFKFAFTKKGITNPEQELGKMYLDLIEAGFKAISQVALYTWANQPINSASIDLSKFDKLLKKIEKNLGNNFSFHKGLNFFSKEVPFIKSTSAAGLASFSHPTWMEFFVARELYKRLRNNNRKAWNWLRSAYIYSRYHQTFIFIAGLLSQQECATFIRRLKKWKIKHWLAQFGNYDKLLCSKSLLIAEIISESGLPAGSFQKELKAIEELISARNNYHFGRASKALQRISPSSEDLFDRILNAFVANSSWNKKSALIHYFQRSLQHTKALLPKIKALLYHPNFSARGAALEALASVECFDQDIIDRATELYFEKDSHNGLESMDYLKEAAKTNPATLTPFVEKFKAKFKSSDQHEERKDTLRAFADLYLCLILRIPGYNEEELTNQTIEKLKDTSIELKDRLLLLRNITKSGIQTKPIVNAVFLLLEEDSEIRPTALMYFRDLYIVKPEIIDKAIQWLTHPDNYTRVRSINYLEAIRYDAVIEEGGREIRLADKVVRMLSAETKDDRTVSYAIDYLGKVGYTNEKLTDALLENLKELDPDKPFGPEDMILRYFINVKHFSEQFFKSILQHETIKPKMDLVSFTSDAYVDNIDQHLSEENQKIMFDMFLILVLQNVKTFWKIRDQMFQTPVNDIWANEQLERVYRTINCMIKLALWKDEKKYRQLLIEA